MEPQYCCEGLRNSVAHAGNSGLAVILISDTDGVLRFRFQSRGCDHAAIEQMRSFVDSLPAPLRHNAPRVNIVAETGLQYCPWCGKRLAELIEHDRDAFRALADSMAYLTRKR